MNGTTLKFGLLAVMFGVAVTITMMAFFPGEEEESPAAPEDAGAVPIPADYERDPSEPIRSGAAEPLPVPENPIPLPTMIALAETLNDPDASVEDDLGVVEELLRQHAKRVSSVPTGGLNEEIVAGLRGRNARKLVFVGETNAKLNEKGELLDRWGTPYFFHPISDQRIDIRSAGPDRELWTRDDVWFGEEPN